MLKGHLDHLDRLDHLVHVGIVAKEVNVGHRARVAKVIQVIKAHLGLWGHKVHPGRGSKAILDHQEH